MTEHEKKVLEAITQGIPKLSEFAKGYVSGYLAAKEEEAGRKKSADADKPEEEKGEGV